jgi:hypothetical protein
VLFGSQLIE